MKYLSEAKVSVRMRITLHLNEQYGQEAVSVT
jgi:hypothetical protein